MFEAIEGSIDGKTALVIAALLTLVICERLAPAARPLSKALQDRATRGYRLAKNLGLGGINAILSWLVVVPVSAAAAQFALDWRPPWLVGVGGMILDLLILDVWIYWWHRANHEVPVLWRFHEVHHLDEFLDATSALRFHAGEVLLSAGARSVVIYLLNIPFLSVVAFETLIAVTTMFHHSNVRLPARFEWAVSLILVTPSIHWVHHHAIRRDTDSNYATLLSLWDWLFASRSSTRRTPSMPIGVERKRDVPFLRLVLRPVVADPDN
jgi:sterol desaturase/sphingolipid hydroxylase (fatty acid hydroxylase superfamily)